MRRIGGRWSSRPKGKSDGTSIQTLRVANTPVMPVTLVLGGEGHDGVYDCKLYLTS